MEEGIRRRLLLYGAVQGVGFRPFVYRLAKEQNLCGVVRNSASGAFVEIEGDRERLEEFGRRLFAEKPDACVILSMEASDLPWLGYKGFSIDESSSGEGRTAILLPDLATCRDCLAEIRQPDNRRYGYAFTNCTNCGPRYTIIEGIPYDRPNTTMRSFAMCAECDVEYRNPNDRRFHAQPIACPECGPRLNETVKRAAARLADGEIVAVKGIGGFQLLCDGRSSEAIQRLRQRKQREEKPFAVMFPNVASVRRSCVMGAEEERVLCGSAAPIVLLRPAITSEIAAEVGRGSPFVGAMLPYSPLHHLLLGAFGYPVVATSGNLSDEPIVIENEAAAQRLKGVADSFLWHDRPVARPCDDSVVRIARGREMVLRRARGYAPLPIQVSSRLPRILAVGAHFKNAIAVSIERQVFLSQHIGDLETVPAFRAFERAIEDLCRLYEFEPQRIACDLHPDYLSTQYAEALAASKSIPLVRVQHHMAHVAACAAENDIEPPYLGVAWDGTGMGTDGSIWGSEFFLVTKAGMKRVAHLRPFRLPGGDRAARDCRRVAFAMLRECGLAVDLGFSAMETQLLEKLLIAGAVNAPIATSMGRLFDAVAALSGVALWNRFEGQAPMKLEAAVSGSSAGQYPVIFEDGLLDWRPVIDEIVRERAGGTEPGEIAQRFHETAARWLVAVAEEVATERVVVSGGVFQNAFLANRSAELLESAGFRMYTHQRVPPNDGGVALGQAMLAALSE